MNSKSAKEILRERAKAMAGKPAQKKQADGIFLEVLAFHLAHETYGIEAGYIREVLPVQEITPLPFTPPFILGLVNIRGQILSVTDLRKFFDLPDKGLTDMNRVIIVRFSDMEIGILADLIIGMRSVKHADLQPPPATFTGIRGVYIKGIAKERLAILDMEKILSDRKLTVHEEI